MTLDDFILLPDPQQVDILYKQGVFIGKRRHEEQIVVLYQLESFYVEIFYRKYRSFISEINYSNLVGIIDLYPQQVNLQYLLNV